MLFKVTVLALLTVLVLSDNIFDSIYADVAWRQQN